MALDLDLDLDLGLVNVKVPEVVKARLYRIVGMGPVDAVHNAFVVLVDVAAFELVKVCA